ncbi:MAG: GTPase Era [Acidobacteriales bacterium]|nr:GTPase Era [Terriglobales bacterium]
MNKSGFVSIIGRPNAGKSTLLNRLVGSKVAIVADKPQTTRAAIQGVLTLDGAQIVFVDTPGIHKPDTTFNRRMMDTVRKALEDRDLLLYLVDATLPFQPAEEQALELIGKTAAPVLLLLNKVDAVKEKAQLLPLIERYSAMGRFEEIFPISALRSVGLEELKSAIVKRLPEGPQYFPDDYLTDQPERYLAAELIREKILHLTRQEVPHSVAVLVDKFEETPRITNIAATVYVERVGQKAIVIGAKGSMLKRVGTSARLEMESLFGRKIFLELFVKVQPGWRENPEFLNAIDWRSMAGLEEN